MMQRTQTSITAAARDSSNPHIDEQAMIHELNDAKDFETKMIKDEQPQQPQDQKHIDQDQLKKYGQAIHDDTMVKAIDNTWSVGNQLISNVINANKISSTINKPPFIIESVDSNTNFDTSSPVAPYTFVDIIPRMIELENVSLEKVESGSQIGTVFSQCEQISKSTEIWNTSLLTSRVKLATKIMGQDVVPMNVVPEGVIRVVQTVGSGQDFQPLANFFEQRLKLVVDLWFLFHRKIALIPKKLTFAQAEMPTAIGKELVRSNVWEGDYPHIFMSIFANQPTWYIEALNHIAEQYPLRIGERGVTNVNNMKTSSTVAACTDQYAAAIVTEYANELMRNQLSMAELQQYVHANTDEHSQIFFKSHTDALSALYNPSQQEWNMSWFFVMSSISAKNRILEFLTPMYASTKRFELLPIENIINPGNQPTDVYSSTLFKTFLQKMASGEIDTPYNMLMLETLSDWFDFTPEFDKLPSDNGIIIEIISLLMHFVAFPRISNQISFHLQYRIQQLLRLYVPKQMDAFIAEFGDARLKGEKYPLEGKTITVTQARAGVVFSVFADLPQPKTRIHASLLDIIERIKRICTPKAYPKELFRKKVAGYPYNDSQYTAYASWDRLPFNQEYTSVETQFSNDATAVMDIASDLVEVREKVGIRTSAMKSMQQFWKSFITQLRTAAKSSALPFQRTFADLQDTLMNSYPFMYDGFDPVNRPFTPPPRLVLQSSPDYPTGTGIPIKQIKVSRYNPAIALRFVLTLEGEIERGLNNAAIGDSTDTSNLPQYRRTIDTVPGLPQHRFYMSLHKQAEKVGFIHQIVAWLSSPNSVDNPLAAISRELSGMLRMNAWIPLVSYLLELVGTDIKDYYTPALRQFGAKDGRSLTLAITTLDPDTNMPSLNTSPGQLLGTIPHYLTPASRASLDIIARKILATESDINLTSNGIYVGRFVVEELRPFIPDVERDWLVIPLRRVTFKKMTAKNGISLKMIIRSEDPNVPDSSYYLPRDPHMPKIMLQIENTTDLFPYHAVLAQAIHFGNLALKINRYFLISEIKDVPSRTTDYSVPATPEYIQDIIMNKYGSFSHIPFTNTSRATNFVMTSTTIAYYIQWISTFSEMDKNLFCASITNTEQQVQQTYLPTPSQTSFGSLGNGTALLDPVLNISKLETGITNFNNEYLAVSPALDATAKLFMSDDNVEISNTYATGFLLDTSIGR